MSTQITITNPPQKPFNSFKSIINAKKKHLTYAQTTKRSYRNHTTEPVEPHTKIKSFLGAAGGVGISTALIARKQKLPLKNPLNIFKLKYGIPEMMAISGLGIIGGVLGGLIGSKKKKEKIDEGVFQFMNATVPLLAVHPVTKIIDNSKYKNNLALRVGAILAALLAGMKLAAAISRKLTLIDSVANIDDAVGAFAVAKIPVISQLEKILPFIFVWCGYRAGQSN